MILRQPLPVQLIKYIHFRILVLFWMQIFFKNSPGIWILTQPSPDDDHLDEKGVVITTDITL